MDPYDFKLESEYEMKRRAFRAQIPGLECFVHEKEKVFPLRDLSAMGMALHDSSDSFGKNELFVMDLLLNKKLFVQALKARVVRLMDGGIVGCTFEDVDRRQETRLDKLILEVQKRLIALRKARKSAE